MADKVALGPRDLRPSATVQGLRAREREEEKSPSWSSKRTTKMARIVLRLRRKYEAKAMIGFFGKKKVWALGRV